ncbi:MAG: HEAT repeat domain-containing protein [Coriobacteriia bacterium]
MEGTAHNRAEEVLRRLAAAASAVRLYPPASALPRQAVEGFVTAAHAATASLGPLRFVVDPEAIRLEDDPVATGQPQVSNLAESLYALQVGQLIVAPGVTFEESSAFLAVIGGDTRDVRAAGGVRTALGAAGVTHLAVIEVSLRAATEEGIAGLDLTAARIDDIAERVAGAAERWAAGAAEGAANDDVAATLAGLEDAARDLAQARVAEALLRLPESVRVAVVEQAMREDSEGARMDGMLDVVARMDPSTLARLLALVAARADKDTEDVASALTLPPEIARELALLLSPPVTDEEARGIPADPDVLGMAGAVADQEGDAEEIARQLTAASPSSAASRALVAAVEVCRARPAEDTVLAVGDAIASAMRAGAFAPLQEAIDLLDGLDDDPALGEALARARTALADSKLLASVCRHVRDADDARLAAVVLRGAGQVGAETLLDCLLACGTAARELLLPIAGPLTEGILLAAGRRIRGSDPTGAAVVAIVAELGGKRAVPALTQALEHVDAAVRRASVTALADLGTAEAAAALAKALGHWDPETARFAAREVGRVRLSAAVPALVRQLEEVRIFSPNHEVRKEIIKSLEAIASPNALPALCRIAGRRIVLGRQRKELQFLARRAVAAIPSA